MEYENSFQIKESNFKTHLEFGICDLIIRINFLRFYFPVFPISISTEKMYQTLKTVYQPKQHEVGQKHSEHSSYFQLSSRCRKMCSNTVFRIWYITSQLRNYRFPKSYLPGLCQRCEPKKRLIFSQTEIAWFLYIYYFILYLYFYQRMILDKQLAIPKKCARQS